MTDAEYKEAYETGFNEGLEEAVQREKGPNVLRAFAIYCIIGVFTTAAAIQHLVNLNTNTHLTSLQSSNSRLAQQLAWSQHDLAMERKENALLANRWITLEGDK